MASRVYLAEGLSRLTGCIIIAVVCLSLFAIINDQVSLAAVLLDEVLDVLLVVVELTGIYNILDGSKLLL